MTTRVKICGIRNEDILDATLAAGADLVGFVFFPPSPRNVDLATAERLAALARGRAEIVALLVDPTDGEIDAVATRISPDIVQLHGSESPDRIAAVRRLAGCRVMKAVKVETADDAAAALEFTDVADVILFDAKAPRGATLPGGNGLAFDWRALEEVTPRLAGRWMLSGGLNPENVAEAIRLTGAPMVDVSSGVEVSPGRKSPELIRRFLRAAKMGREEGI